MSNTKLVDDIIKDGVVDANEVKQLKEVFLADGVIDREEADALFKINDACSGNDNSPDWGVFFIEAISSHVLKDEDTPGVIDNDEGDWLVKSIGADGQVDGLEKNLLTSIKTSAKEIQSDSLNELIATL